MSLLIQISNLGPKLYITSQILQDILPTENEVNISFSQVLLKLGRSWGACHVTITEGMANKSDFKIQLHYRKPYLARKLESFRSDALIISNVESTKLTANK